MKYAQGVQNKHMLGIAKPKESQCEFEREGNIDHGSEQKTPKCQDLFSSLTLGSKGEKRIMNIKGNFSMSLSISKLNLRGKNRRYREVTRLKRRKH